MNREKKINFFGGLLILAYLIYGYKLIPPEYSFQNDSLIKFLQTYSLYISKYTSQSYLYFFRDIDPGYKLFYLRNMNYFLEVNGLYVGPFSVLFSYITSLYFKIIPYKYFSLISGIIFIFILLIMKKIWKFGNSIMILAAFGTGMLLYAYEYSENMMYIFLIVLFFTIFFRIPKFYPFAGFILGLSFVLRLESLFILFAFDLSFIYLWFRNKNSEFKKIIIVNFIFFLVVILFMIYNFQEYNNILGTKYLADENSFWNFKQKFTNYISLLFGHPYVDGFKLGFLGLTPIFLIVIYYFGINFKNSDFELRFIYLIFILYLIMTPFFSPHDGFWSWGARYLNPLILPGCILADRMVALNTGYMKKIFYVLLIYSCIMVHLGMRIVSLSSKAMKDVSNLIQEYDGDIRMYDNSSFAMFSGTQLINKPTLILNGDPEQNNILENLSKKYTGKKIVFYNSSILYSLATELKINIVELDDNLSILREKFFFEKEIDTNKLGIKVYIFTVQ